MVILAEAEKKPFDKIQHPFMIKNIQKSCNRRELL